MKKAITIYVDDCVESIEEAIKYLKTKTRAEDENED